MLLEMSLSQYESKPNNVWGKVKFVSMLERKYMRYVVCMHLHVKCHRRSKHVYAANMRYVYIYVMSLFKL